MSKLTEAVLQNTASLEAAVNTAAQLGGVERQHCVKNPLKGLSNEILASSFFNLVIRLIQKNRDRNQKCFNLLVIGPGSFE